MYQAPGGPAKVCVSGGFYVAFLSSLTEYMSPELIPDKVLSASRCICKFFPDAWAIEWTNQQLEERLKQASAFDVSATDLPKVVTWATESISTASGWPNAFYTLEAAQEARERSLPHDSELVIFGLGLHRSDIEAFPAGRRARTRQLRIFPTGETVFFNVSAAARRSFPEVTLAIIHNAPKPFCGPSIQSYPREAFLRKWLLSSMLSSYSFGIIASDYSTN